MGYTSDIILALPIGIIYNFFITKMSDLMTKDEDYEIKIHKYFIICLSGAIFGIISAIFIFSEQNILENRCVKYGMTIGSVLLLINTLIFNWDLLSEDTKLLTIGILLICIIIVSYTLK